MSRILIVEDEESIAELERDYLELSGFDVEIEASGTVGLERALKRPSDFVRFMGSPIQIKLYRPRNGLKEIPGVLTGYDAGRVTAQCGKEEITFEKSEVAQVRLRVEF